MTLNSSSQRYSQALLERGLQVLPEIKPPSWDTGIFKLGTVGKTLLLTNQLKYLCR